MSRPYRLRGQGSRTGAAEHALVLEAGWCRNAFGARRSVDLHEVTSMLEYSMRTITSMLCTGDGAGLALRASRVHAVNIHHCRTQRNVQARQDGIQLVGAPGVRSTTPYEDIQHSLTLAGDEFILDIRWAHKHSSPSRDSRRKHSKRHPEAQNIPPLHGRPERSPRFQAY